jgi:hypothetical protein
MEAPMVLLASTYDQSRFFRAEDVPQEKNLRIKSVTEEMVNDRAGQLKKLAVWFTNAEKGLILNKTNNRTIRGEYGDDTAGWINKLIVLFTAATTDGNGRPTKGLRVRIPPPKQAAAAPSSTRPSGNGQTANTALQQFTETRPIPAPQPGADDFDDEIPL